MAANNVEKTQSGISHSQWPSAESLSSSSSDDTRLLGMFSSATRGRPPLPPPHGSSLNTKPSWNEGPEEPAVSRKLNQPQPAVTSLASQRQCPAVKKTIVETHKHLDQEVTNQIAPQPLPRRRLASFGGVSSPGSHSPFTGLGAYNLNNNGNKPPLSSRGSTGCLRQSQESSGRTTPVTSLGPIHLQHVRDQMVVALQRLKELEEQLKIIPILQVKISVLQEEKRQLVSQLKNQSDEDINDAKGQYNPERSDNENKINPEKGLEDLIRSDFVDLREVRQLTKEMLPLERPIQNGNAIKSLTVGSEKDIHITLSKPLKENKYVYTDQVKTRSIGTEVSEVSLGIYTEQEAELDAQQLIIDALEGRICHLEAELKESALQSEISRLKMELQAAGARNRADKASFARPFTVDTSTEARPHITSQGVGNHAEFRDASTGEPVEMKTLGICCRPELKDVCTGPDVPMSHWEVREQVETMEKGVGIHVFTNTQGVGMEIKLCDAETNTEVPEEKIRSKKEKVMYNSVACGDCSVDVVVCEAKEMVSQGIATNQVRGVDLGIMALPQTASQHANTVSSSVSHFTNTKQAFITDSSSNTFLSTKDKQTNTTQAVTRTVSVGNRVKDMKCTPETCTSSASLLANALKQTPGKVTKLTRDIGVGFTNINDNFLVGLKTRNMASGPSHLPDPIKTRSIGVGEGRIQDLTVLSSDSGIKSDQQTLQSQRGNPELNYYIEKMHRLLREHGTPLTVDYALQKKGFMPHDSKQGSAVPKLSSNSKGAAQGGTEVHSLEAQPPGNIAGLTDNLLYYRLLYRVSRPYMWYCM